MLALAVSACGGKAATTSPTRAPSTVTYYAAGTPYEYKGQLYIAHKVQPGSWSTVQTAGAYTAAQREEPDGSFTLVILRDGKVIETERGLYGGPVFSSRGTKLAWVIQSSHDAGSLVVADVSNPARLLVLGRLSISLRPQDGEGISVGVSPSDSGSVIYELGPRSWQWTPGGKPVRTSAAGGEISVQPTGFSGVSALVVLSPDHLWGAWYGPHTVTVQKPEDPASRFKISLPAGAHEDAPFVEWESPTVLTDAGTRAFICDITIRTCRVRPM